MTVVNETVGERPMGLLSERAPFVMLPRWLLHHPDITEGAKVLYCVLHDLVNGREGPTRPVTRGQLAELCGVSVDTVDRRLAQLVAAGAVEKQALVPAGGQQANVYQVWLTPREGLHRVPPGQGDGAAGERGRNDAAPVEGGANALVNRSRENAAPPKVVKAKPQPCGPGSRTDAAPNREEEVQEPPQPPRRAGGPDLAKTTPLGRRAAGTNPRALTDRAEAEREREEAERRLAEIDAEMQARRADADAERVEAERFEAEAAAISAALDDLSLHAVAALVSPTLRGPLATSPLAMTRAVVAWCRAAAADHPGALTTAVQLGLTKPLQTVPGGHPPLRLPVAPPDTMPLRQRIATQLRTASLSAVDDD